MQIESLLARALALAIAGTGVAHAHSDMAVASDSDGSGNLIVDYDFAAKARATYSTTIGGISTYSIDDPGFVSLEADEPGEAYVLDPGTTVTVEITAVDGKVSMLLNSVLLDTTGETVVLGTEGAAPPNDLHHHADFQLQLRLPAGQYGEGRISFKLTGDNGYGDSEEYTLHVTNGFLNGVEYDSAAEDTASVKCQAAIGKAVRNLAAAKYQLMTKCLDAVQKVTAKEALAVPPASLSAAWAKAGVVCADENGTGDLGKTLLGRIRAAKQKALASVRKACGSNGSGDYTEDNDLLANLGFVECNTEELVSATYGFASQALQSFDVRAAEGGRCVGGTDASAPCPPYACAGGGTCGTSLDLFFPCLVPHAGEDH